MSVTPGFLQSTGDGGQSSAPKHENLFFVREDEGTDDIYNEQCDEAINEGDK